jgi:hypothetical protein
VETRDIWESGEELKKTLNKAPMDRHELAPHVLQVQATTLLAMPPAEALLKIHGVIFPSPVDTWQHPQ